MPVRLSSKPRQIRERLGPAAPIVLGVSASSLPNDRTRCLEAGMSDYLAKPLELHTLAQALLPPAPTPYARCDVWMEKRL